MSSKSNSALSPGKKLRLRPLASVKREQMIQKNLMTMNDRIAKKKRAQAIYYQQHEPNIHMQNVQMRPSVHDRLDMNNRSRKKVPFIGTNTNAILPRNKSYVKRNNQGVFSAQYRLNRLRLNNMDQRVQNINHKLYVPENLRVQVVNNSATQLVNSRFKIMLNPLIQSNIKSIQMENPRQIFHGIYPITPVATSLTLDFRFTHLS